MGLKDLPFRATGVPLRSGGSARTQASARGLGRGTAERSPPAAGAVVLLAHGEVSSDHEANITVPGAWPLPSYVKRWAKLYLGRIHEGSTLACACPAK